VYRVRVSCACVVCVCRADGRDIPETIHLPPVTEKLEKMQYFSLTCPV